MGLVAGIRSWWKRTTTGATGAPLSRVEPPSSVPAEATREAFALFDANSRLLDCSAGFSALSRRSAEQLRGIDYAVLFGELALDDVASAPLPLPSTNRNHLLLEDGTKVPVHLTRLSAAASDAGAFWIVLRDLPDNHAALRKACQEVAFFQSIAENVADYVAVLDTQGRRLYNSPAYAGLFGSTEALRGTDSFANIHPEDRDHVRMTFAKTVETGVGQVIDYRFLLPDGSIRHMESRGSVVRDAEGKVKRVIVVASDITERKRFEERMREFAYFDVLTGLPNRRMLLDRLQQSIRSSRRNSQFNALLFFDLDDFKRINDEFGHEAGDHLLREVACRALACMRETDTVGRLGGDEFVVLINQLDADTFQARILAERIAEKLRATLDAPYSIDIDGKTRQAIQQRCPASIGAILFDGQAKSPDELLRQGDQAMYQAKASGGNSVRLGCPHADHSLRLVAHGQGDESFEGAPLH